MERGTVPRAWVAAISSLEIVMGLVGPLARRRSPAHYSISLRFALLEIHPTSQRVASPRVGIRGTLSTVAGFRADSDDGSAQARMGWAESRYRASLQVAQV